MRILKILMILATILFCLFLVHRICLIHEASQLQPYGRKVEVFGQEMNYVEMGEEHTKTLVFLPGYGTIAPGLDFYPLAKRLSQDFHVLILEPFGYGDSDQTDRERSLENMTEEIHEALDRLKISHYYLCGHSISGIYSIYYLQQYAQEVQGFVGLDTSLPQQGQDQAISFNAWARHLAQKLGWVRVARFLFPQGFMATGADYPFSLQEQVKIRVNRDFANDNNLQEGLSFTKNWQKVQGLSYPASIKCIFILADQGEGRGSWRYLATEALLENTASKIYLLAGGHYIHRSQVEEIARIVRREFL